MEPSMLQETGYLELQQGPLPLPHQPAEVVPVAPPVAADEAACPPASMAVSFRTCHIIWHVSYSVPVLFLRAQHPGNPKQVQQASCMELTCRPTLQMGNRLAARRWQQPCHSASGLLQQRTGANGRSWLSRIIRT